MFDRTVWQPMLNKVRDFIVQNFPDTKEKRALLLYLGEWRYHFWHNSPPMPKWAYATDIDFIELGYGLIPKALIETKTEHTTNEQWQQDVFKEMAQTLQLPFYIVTFPISLEKFTVDQIYPTKNRQLLTEAEYQDFLLKIRT